MKIKTVILLLMSFSFSCQNADREIARKSEKIKLSESVTPIVDSLAKFPVVDDEATGYGGEESPRYLHFKNLLANSTDQELEQLTNHDSVAVRAYAFWALAKRKNSVVKDIIEHHLNDDTGFIYFSGCTGVDTKINKFYLSVLTPNQIDLDCYKLSADDLARLEQKLKH
jgi:hypothetical protein